MAYTTINDPSAYFKVQLYTGDGSADHAITFDDTDTDMQPDLVWIKNRDATDAHCLFDAARGVTKLANVIMENGEEARHLLELLMELRDTERNRYQMSVV